MHGITAGTKSGLLVRDLIRAVLLQPRLDLFGCQAASTSFESRERFFGRAVTYLRKRQRGLFARAGGRGPICDFFIHGAEIFFLFVFGESGVAASRTLEREMTTENAIFRTAPRL